MQKNADPSASKLSIEILPGKVLTLGRADFNDIVISKNPLVCRRHARVWIDIDELMIECFDAANNSLMFRVAPHRKLRLKSGPLFNIGTIRFQFAAIASTPFVLSNTILREELTEKNRSQPDIEPIERIYESNELRSVDFSNPAQKLAFLVLWSISVHGYWQ